MMAHTEGIGMRRSTRSDLDRSYRVEPERAKAPALDFRRNSAPRPDGPYEQAICRLPGQSRNVLVT